MHVNVQSFLDALLNFKADFVYISIRVYDACTEIETHRCYVQQIPIYLKILKLTFYLKEIYLKVLVNSVYLTSLVSRCISNTAD